MRVTEETIEAYAFCQAFLPVANSRRRIRCEGYEPVPATIIRTTRLEFYGDWSAGADATDVDMAIADKLYNGHVYLRFADDADRQCPHCGEWLRAPMLDAQHVQYDPISGDDPDRLLKLDEEQLELAKRNADSSTAVADALREMGQGLQAVVLELREDNRVLRQQLMAATAGPNGDDVVEEAPEPVKTPTRRTKAS
jgi:hypothetical protein